MPSLRAGDYDLVTAIQSPRDADRWYRVLARRHTATTSLSCDCPAWIYNRTGNRICKHTAFAAERLQPTTPTPTLTVPRMRPDHPFIGAIRTQWAPLRQFVPDDGWELHVARVQIGSDAFRLIEMRATGPDGMRATGTVALAEQHRLTVGAQATAVAGWSGYAIAAAFCRQAGVPLTGEPPAHYRLDYPASDRRQPGDQPAADDARAILQIGNRRDLGDGLTPTQRAENTLRLFLGATTYALLEQRHFLDVSSGLRPGRVYRVRRDPQKRYERRIRVFEGGRYVNDFCVVRAQSVPEADHYLTVYFGLIANEAWVLSVVGRSNVFSPWSDGRERETVPAVWQPRAAPAAAMQTGT